VDVEHYSALWDMAFLKIAKINKNSKRVSK